MIDGTAISYFLAYKCLMDRNHDVKTYHNDYISIYFFPAVSLAAFSCELALKSKLLSESGRTSRSHDLSKLFSQFSLVKQREITNRTIKLFNLKSEKLLSQDRLDLEAFRHLLDRHKDSFVNWRYFHEGIPETDVDFLEALMFCLNDFDEEYYNYIESSRTINRTKTPYIEIKDK
jgi:HEPN domain-containing protein